MASSTIKMDWAVRLLSITILAAIHRHGYRSSSPSAYGASGASMCTGKVVHASVVQELGPVLTALLVGGQVGSDTTAESGGMDSIGEVDAIKDLEWIHPKIGRTEIGRHDDYVTPIDDIGDIVGFTRWQLGFITMVEVGVLRRSCLNKWSKPSGWWTCCWLSIFSLATSSGSSAAGMVCVLTPNGTEGVGILSTNGGLHLHAILVSDFALLESFGDLWLRPSFVPQCAEVFW